MKFEFSKALPEIVRILFNLFEIFIFLKKEFEIMAIFPEICHNFQTSFYIEMRTHGFK